MLPWFVVVGIFGASSAAATEFQTHDVGGGAFAEWSTCDTGHLVPGCSFTQIQAYETFLQPGNNGKQDCVAVFEVDGNNGHGGWSHEVGGGGCSVGVSIAVPASLVRGQVRGELAARDCQILPPQPTTCTPTTLRIALDWQSTSDVTRFPNVVSHESPVAPEERCLEYYLPFRSTTNATVTGQIDGLPSIPPLAHAGMEFGGTIVLGTIPVCFD
jgi:hypothetical protein